MMQGVETPFISPGEIDAGVGTKQFDYFGTGFTAADDGVVKWSISIRVLEIIKTTVIEDNDSDKSFG